MGLFSSRSTSQANQTSTTTTTNVDSRDQRVYNTQTDFGAIKAAENISVEGLRSVEQMNAENAFAFVDVTREGLRSVGQMNAENSAAFLDANRESLRTVEQMNFQNSAAFVDVTKEAFGSVERANVETARAFEAATSQGLRTAEFINLENQRTGREILSGAANIAIAAIGVSAEAVEAVGAGNATSVRAVSDNFLQSLDAISEANRGVRADMVDISKYSINSVERTALQSAESAKAALQFGGDAMQLIDAGRREAMDSAREAVRLSEFAISEISYSSQAREKILGDVLGASNRTMADLANNSLDFARDTQWQTLQAANQVIRENADLSRDLVMGGQDVAIEAIRANQSGTERVLQSVDTVDRGGAEEVSVQLVKWLPISLGVISIALAIFLRGRK